MRFSIKEIAHEDQLSHSVISFECGLFWKAHH